MKCLLKKQKKTAFRSAVVVNTPYRNWTMRTAAAQAQGGGGRAGHSSVRMETLIRDKRGHETVNFICFPKIIHDIARSTPITNNINRGFHTVFIPGIGVICLDMAICLDRQPWQTDSVTLTYPLTSLPARAFTSIAHRVQHSHCSSIFIECC